MKCPDCKGGKKTREFAELSSGGCRLMEFKCFRCKGAGIVPKEMNKWMFEGQKIRDFRRMKDMTMREYARKVGVTAYNLSQAENGYVDPHLIKINQ